MSCYLCNSENYFKRSGSVRDDSSIDVLECVDCGLVYLSSLGHIKEGHYEESGMHSEEIKIEKWLEECKEDDNRRYQFVKNKINNKVILDFGCGAGGFIEIVNQRNNIAKGIELEIALQSSFKKRGIMVFPNILEAQKEGLKYDLITAFHVVEHLQHPIKVIQELSNLLKDQGEIIIEVPNSDDALFTLYENNDFQDFSYWSQHLFLFNKKTITELIKQSGLKLNWIKHVQRYPLSNHLYWMAKGRPGGHIKWSYLDNNELSIEYEKQLANICKTDTIMVGISKP